MAKYSRQSKRQEEIALTRIRDLFTEAKNIFHEDSKLSDRYVSLARKIAMKFRIKIPSNLKKQYCSKCYSYLFPGSNVRIRISHNKIIYYCKICKNFMRLPLTRNLDHNKN